MMYWAVQNQLAKTGTAVHNLVTRSPPVKSYLHVEQQEECCMLIQATLTCLLASLRPVSVNLFSSQNKTVHEIELKLTLNPRTAYTSTTLGRCIGGAEN
jgi:hypothetical protein